MATTEAYEFMLKKDPHDFLALRGLMLAAAHLTDTSELDQVNDSFSYDVQMVNRAIENASKEDKEYFTEFAKVYAEKKRLVDRSEEIGALREEKKKTDSVIEQNYVKNRFSSTEDPIIPFIAIWVATAVFILLTVVFAKDLIHNYASNSDYAATSLAVVIFFGVISLFLVIINCFGYYFEIRKRKDLKKANAELYDEAGKIDDKIRELENESSKLSGDIRRFSHEFVRKDRFIMRDKKSK